MRVKNILSLIVFAAAFTVSTAFAGLTVDSGAAEKISALLQQDVQNGQLRDVKVSRLSQQNNYTSVMSNYLAVTNDYIGQSGAIDENQLPEDFQLAWLKHMKAWRNFEQFLSENQNSARDYQYQRQFRKLDGEITSTWYQVLRVAKQHGATIPDGAY